MVIVGFSCKTHLILARILCRKFRHCVIIVPYKNKFILHQFVRRGNVAHIAITTRDIKLLKLHGWKFICLDCTYLAIPPNKSTCVNYVKHALGIRNFLIQTPDALFRYLKKSDKNVRFFI